jgi:hypothetical protein
MAIGYNIIGQLVLVSKANLIDINSKNIDEIVKVMEKVVENNNIKIKTHENEAKKLSSLKKTKL